MRVPASPPTRRWPTSRGRCLPRLEASPRKRSPEPMIRVLAFTLGIILAALLLASLADQPGSITIDWLGYQVKTSAFVGVLALSALVVLLMLTWSAIRYLVTRPK